MVFSYELFGRAQNHFLSGAYNLALAEYDQCLTEDPNYQQAIINRAFTLLKLGRAVEALSALNSWITQNPDSYDAHVLRGAIYESLYGFKQAFEDYENALLLQNGGTVAKKQMEFLPLNALQKVFNAVQEQKLLEKIKQRKNGYLPNALNARLAKIKQNNSNAGISCDLSCKAMCCYFKEDMYLHGVMIYPQNLKSINEHILSLNLTPSDYIQSKEFTPDMDDGMKDNIKTSRYKILVDGRHYINYPKRNMDSVKDFSDGDLPKKNGGDSIAWAKDGAKACKFLGPDGCMIFAAKWDGGNGLKACRRFNCQTAQVDNLLKKMGLTDDARDYMSFKQLSQFYEKYVITLFKLFFLNDSTNIYFKKMEALHELSEKNLTTVQEIETLHRYKYLLRKQEKIIGKKLDQLKKTSPDMTPI